MSNRNDISRITIDISKEQHKKLKAKAAMLGKSMREMVIEALETYYECSYSHTPNKETRKTIKNIEEDKDLVEIEDIDDFLKSINHA